MINQFMQATVTNALNHYVQLANLIGNVSNERKALVELVDAINMQQLDGINIANRTDARFFVVELHGLRVMTVYEDALSGKLAVDVIELMPEPAASVLMSLFQTMIQIKVIKWNAEAADKRILIHAKLTTQLEGLKASIEAGNVPTLYPLGAR